MAEKTVLTKSNEETSALFGTFDSHAGMIERAFGVRISNRNNDPGTGDAIVITGDAGAVNSAARVLEYLKRMTGDGDTISAQTMSRKNRPRCGLKKERKIENIPFC